MCESDLCPVTCGGVSNGVIYLRAARVNTRRNALWAATRTEHGPASIGASAVSDLCAARRVRGSNVRRML